MFEYIFSNNLKVITLSNDPSISGTNFLLLGDTITNRANNLIKFAINNNKYRFALINPTKKHNNEVTTYLYYHDHLGASTRKMQIYSYGYIVNLWLTSQKFSARIGVELKIQSVPIKLVSQLTMFFSENQLKLRYKRSGVRSIKSSTLPLPVINS